MTENPFNYSVPVRPADFINREKIINKILNITIGRKSKGDIWLIGARQIGKTSLLQNIEYTYKNKKHDRRIKDINNFTDEFYKKIKKQYEETAKRLVIDWHSRKNLPETTFNKIKKLFHGLGITIEFLGVKLTFKKDT